MEKINLKKDCFDAIDVMGFLNRIIEFTLKKGNEKSTFNEHIVSDVSIKNNEIAASVTIGENKQKKIALRVFFESQKCTLDYLVRKAVLSGIEKFGEHYFSDVNGVCCIWISLEHDEYLDGVLNKYYIDDEMVAYVYFLKKSLDENNQYNLMKMLNAFF